MHPLILRNFNMYVLVLITINLHINFEMSSFIRSKDMTGPQNVEIGHVTLTMPTWGKLVNKRLVLHMVNSCTKFEVSSFSHSRDISGGVKF